MQPDFDLSIISNCMVADFCCEMKCFVEFYWNLISEYFYEIDFSWMKCGISVEYSVELSAQTWHRIQENNVVTLSYRASSAAWKACWKGWLPSSIWSYMNETYVGCLIFVLTFNCVCYYVAAPPSNKIKYLIRN